MALADASGTDPRRRSVSWGGEGVAVAVEPPPGELHALEFLVNDRFDHFRDMVLKAAGAGQRALSSSSRLRRGSTKELTARILGRSDSEVARVCTPSHAEQPGSFMRQFFEAVGEVQSHIAKGKDDVKQMDEAVKRALGATSQVQESEASKRVQALTLEVNQSISAAQDGLKILQARTDQEVKVRPHAQEVKIRNSMQHAMMRKQEQLLLDFQQVQKDYKNGLKARQGHELAVLMPEISEEQREEMIQNGETTSTVLVQRMAGAHATLVDEVNRIREKHQDVLRVEQSIADMAQMFQEMAVLVNNHGEMLDSIEEHTRQVKAATAKGEQNLKQTMKAQHQHRRYLCCMMIIMIIVAISILSPVLARA